MAQTGRRVAVIGAGPSGLVAIKELTAEGHAVTCFERSDDLGGIFRFTEQPGGVYASVRMVSSAALTAFSDFPLPPRHAPHLTHQEYLAYLRSYAAHFKIQSAIKFRHTVTQMDPMRGGRWALRVRDEATGQDSVQEFDAVAVCSGVHQHPAMPRFEGQEVFRGAVVHSYAYKRAEPFRGKRVVVVGLGESGSDIVDEISRVASDCVLSVRRGALVVPRLIFGEPNDYYTTRLFYTLPDWLLRIRHPNIWHWPSVVMIVMLLGLLELLFRLGQRGLEAIMQVSPLVELGVLALIVVCSLWLVGWILLYLTRDVPPKELAIIARLMRDSQVGHAEQFATKTTGAVRAIAQGRCRLKPGMKAFTEDGVEFVDGTRHAADAVVLCTGFETRFSFLGRDTFDLRRLYKNCFDVELGPTCCFLGMARPALGAIPPIAEMQARWFARLLSGAASLPPPEQMREGSRQDAEHHQRMFRVVTNRITGLVDYTSYMDELAGFIGCRPRFSDLAAHPWLLWCVYTQPFSAHQYRLLGPGSKPDAAVSHWRRIGMTPIRVVYMILGLTLLVAIAETLYRLGFQTFKPRLRL